MKKITILATILIFTSCSKSSNKFTRTPAQAYEARRDFYLVGDIKTSLLDPESFTEKYGDVWVLMDGRSTSGSEFSNITGMANVPDARGKFLRMINNGKKCEKPASCQYDEKDRELGSFQSDMYKSHNHGTNAHELYVTHHSRLEEGHGGPDRNWRAAKTDAAGGKETRPKNIGVNYYVKINSCGSSSDECL